MSMKVVKFERRYFLVHEKELMGVYGNEREANERKAVYGRLFGEGGVAKFRMLLKRIKKGNMAVRLYVEREFAPFLFKNVALTFGNDAVLRGDSEDGFPVFVMSLVKDVERVEFGEDCVKFFTKKKEPFCVLVELK